MVNPLFSKLLNPVLCEVQQYEPHFHRRNSRLRTLSVITDAAEVKRILRHLVKMGCPPEIWNKYEQAKVRQDLSRIIIETTM